MNYNYLVEDKYIDLLNEPWDVLIILDACRFDYFKEIYKFFFPKSHLKLAITKSTSTMEWLNFTFGNQYYEDIIYISGTPYVNSIIETISPKVGKFKAKDHFSEINDVWDWGWDKKIQSVNPWNINKGFFKPYKKYGDKKRYILHYMQPHAPYRNLKWTTKNLNKPGASGNREDKIYDQIKRIIGGNCTKYFGEVITWNILNFFKVETINPMQFAYLKKGIKGLRSLYKDNLIYVLEAVEALNEVLDLKLLLTSDHGERLGEHMRFGHWKPRHDEVIKVPWLWI